MRTVKSNQKNGAASKTNTPAQTQKVSETSTAKQQPKVSLEDRIQKVEELRSLTGKRQRTVDTYHQLRTFQFGSDENCTLVLTDSQGQKFATNNSALISMLTDYFATLLNDKVSELDDEILTFKL